MISETKKVIELMIILEKEKEIKWLRNLVQNYLGNGEEDDFSKEMRSKIFNICNNILTMERKS